MQSRRWLNQSQPQTLVIACFLLYINAAFGVLNLLSAGGISFTGLSSFYLVLALAYYVITIGGGIGAGYGIANERKWGYLLGLGTAFSPFVLALIIYHRPLAGGLINIIFEIALVALLLHPQSREYEKIWFK